MSDKNKEKPDFSKKNFDGTRYMNNQEIKPNIKPSAYPEKKEMYKRDQPTSRIYKADEISKHQVKGINPMVKLKLFLDRKNIPILNTFH